MYLKEAKVGYDKGHNKGLFLLTSYVILDYDFK